jgi:O-antigen/teichoic acid export membrane protein
MIAFGHLTAKTALMLYFGGALGACLFTVIALRVRFENVRGNLKELRAEVRRYGFNVYLGGLADNSTYKLNNLLIAGYVDTTWLGFYSIAAAMVGPMASFSDSLSAALYRSFTQKDRINIRVLLANAAFLTASSVFIAACARPLIGVVLTKKYLPATELVYILVITAFFQGLYHPLSGFLSAHGKGREARTISFTVSAVNLSVAALLIPRFGAFGAAIGSSVAKFCQFLGNLYYYRIVTRQLRAATPMPQLKAEAPCT